MMIPCCILAIEDDDDRAFMEQLYLNYHRLMYSEINQIMKNEWDTEDLMQSVLEKLIDKIPELRTKPRNNLVNYIISACKNTAYNFIRDNGKGKSVSFSDYTEGKAEGYQNHDMELPLIREEEFSALQRIWPKLDERTRAVLEGYYILEKPTDVLAREFGLSFHSFHGILSRSRRRAFALLKKELEEGSKVNP